MNKALSFLIFLLSVAPLTSSAQVQSQGACVATVRARAGMSLTATDAKRLCEENPMAVVNCAITQMQGARLTANLETSLKQCRLEWTASSLNGSGVW